MAAVIITKKIGEKTYNFKFGVLTSKIKDEAKRKKGLAPHEILGFIEEEALTIWAGLKAFGFAANSLPADFSEDDACNLFEDVPKEEQNSFFEEANEGLFFTQASWGRVYVEMERSTMKMKELELQPGTNGTTTNSDEKN